MKVNILKHAYVWLDRDNHDLFTSEVDGAFVMNTNNYVTQKELIIERFLSCSDKELETLLVKILEKIDHYLTHSESGEYIDITVMEKNNENAN
tara:strand:- start:14593 stop:14871 length:279 start_codon:yes stop_codon:yes gene_type:complete